jgi:small-conductance mechanosensitive channel
MNNIWLTWGDVFTRSFQDLWWGFVQFAPKLIIAIILFVVGWILGSLLAKGFEQVFSTLKVDKALRSVGADELVRKTGMNLNTGYFIGQVIKWFVIILFLLPALSLVLPPAPGSDVNAVTEFLKEDVLIFLPRVVIAAFILIIATIVSDALSKAVMAGSRAMNLTSANMLGAVAKYSVWVFAFIVALGQLGVAEYYMNVLFTGIVAMLALGGALAFGLGGRDAAARFISKLGEEVSQK